MQIMQSSMGDEAQEPQQHEGVLYHPSPFLMQPQESIIFHDGDDLDDAEINLASGNLSLNPFAWSKHRAAKPSTSHFQSRTTSDGGAGTNRSPQHKASKHEKQILEERQDSISEIHYRIRAQHAKIEEEDHRYGLEPPEATQDYAAATATSLLPPTRTNLTAKLRPSVCIGVSYSQILESHSIRR